MSERKDVTELVEMARRIHAWQLSQAKTNSQMIREYPGLGSDKTYGRLRDGQTEEYDIDAQLANFRAVWAVIEALSGQAGTEEVLYDDLTAVLQIKRLALEMMKNEGTNRVAIVEGSSGIGKTKGLWLLGQRYGTRVVMIEAADCWGDSPSALLGAILRSLGCSDLPASRVERLEKTVELLCRSRRCLVIDEAHHLGPHCLNGVKTLVNQTPGEFILACIPTLWARLEGKAYMEARQLTTNRLAERIKLELTEADIVRYLRHAFAEADDAVLKAGAKLIRSAAVGTGNMAFVRDVAAVLRRLCQDGKPDVKLISDAVAAAAKRR